MRSIRLLPVVIFAALALLVFKGIGIATNGGYVLTGPVAAVAEDAAPDPTDNNAPMPAAPSDPTAADTGPMLTDTAPTLVAKVDPASSEASSAAANASSASAVSSAATTESAASASSASSLASRQAAACPDTPILPSSAAAPAPSSAAAAPAELTDKIGNALVTGCPDVSMPTNAYGDALPTIKDGEGHIVPLETADGDNSVAALTQHLSDRRAELDKRETDLDTRAALVQAAEKQLDDRTKALAALQAQVDSLVDQKQATEDASFKAVVSMYETMKPKDAAKIFDTLDLNVLLKIARAINPRNMSPILAAMSSAPAEALTTALASATPVNTVADATAPGGTDVAALPQIVGH